MTPLEEAVGEIASVLEAIPLPYMLVGGLAVTLWGAPRSTLDVDVSVWIEPEDLEERVQNVCSRLSARPADPLGFVTETHVLPVTTSRGVRADLIMASLPLEREMIERAHAPTRPGIIEVFRREIRSAG